MIKTQNKNLGKTEPAAPATPAAGEPVAEASAGAEFAFDYSTIDMAERKFLSERAEQIRSLARVTASSIAEIGKHLTEVKERLKHGQFLKWIGAEFGWKERTAENFMTVHTRFKSANFADLQVDVSALYLIAAPSTPEPVRAEVIRRAKAGERMTYKAARAAIANYKAASEVTKMEARVAIMLADYRATGESAEANLQKNFSTIALLGAVLVLGAMDPDKVNVEITSLSSADRADFWEKVEAAWGKLGALRGSRAMNPELGGRARH